MAQVKISALAQLTALALDDKLNVVDQSTGLSKYIDIQDFTVKSTFTPELYGNTTAGSNTYSIQNGNIRRYGDVVFFRLQISISTVDSAMAGDLRIKSTTTFPTADVGHTAVSISDEKGVTVTSAQTIRAYFRSGGNEITLELSDGNTVANVTDAEIGSTFNIMVSGTYIAA